MVDFERLAAFAVVVAILIAVPGPSVLFVVGRGVALGRRAAVTSAAGNDVGLLVQLAAVALGLGAIVAASATLFTAIKLLGAGYLIYLGVQAWRHRKRLATMANATGPAPGHGTVRLLRDGFVVGATNPKGLLIFTAVLPQFIDPARGHPTSQLLVLGLVCVTIAFISDAAWGLLAGAARSWLGRSARRLEAMGGAGGVVMVGLGVQLALTGQRQ